MKIPFQLMNRRWSLVLAILSCLVGSAWAEPPRWPLDLPTRYLTSNFMEYRDGRFHAGIDLKTRSEMGYPVRAVEDGHIVRVRATPGAYGRAVYLKGHSGRTYVFAHLMRFNDTLRARIQQVQADLGTYRAELYFRPDEWPIRQGEILGLSGQSGTNGPHLHFEVRDENGWPVDPLAHGFAVPDTLPPVIHDLTAWPVDPRVRLNGQPVAHQLAGGDPGLRGELPVLAVDGPVAFSARIVEYTDIRGHRLEPWLIELECDGQVVYSCRNETFGFHQNSLQRLEWADRVDLENGTFREHWLHRRKPNSLTGRTGDLWYLGDAGQGLGKGAHRLVLRALDRAGNVTEASLVLVVGNNPAAGAPDWKARSLGIQDGEGFRLTPFFQVGDLTDMDAEILAFHPVSGDPVLEPLELVVKAWTPEPDAVLASQGLEPAGPGAFFLAVDWVIESDLPVAFPGFAPGGSDLLDDPQVGVYRRRDRGGWTLTGTLLAREDGQLGCALDIPGLYAVLRDTVPPLIQLVGGPDVGPGSDVGYEGVTMPRWEIVRIEILDAGSGVVPSSPKVQLDGEPIIAEPDLIRDRILVELPDTLEPGIHRLDIEAADEAGNTSSRQVKIRLAKTRR